MLSGKISRVLSNNNRRNVKIFWSYYFENEDIEDIAKKHKLTKRNALHAVERVLLYLKQRYGIGFLREGKYSSKKIIARDEWYEKNKDRRRRLQLKWYHKNKTLKPKKPKKPKKTLAERKEYRRKYYKKNKKRIIATQMKYYKKNKERCRRLTKRWQRKHRKEQLRAKKEYYRKNAKILRAKSKARYRRRKHGSNYE
jgi:hypothetical protein